MFEEFRNLHTGRMRDGDSLAIGGMRFDEVIDRRTGRRLTTFVEPEAWNHPRIIGSPDARTKHGADVVAMMQAEVPMM